MFKWAILKTFEQHPDEPFTKNEIVSVLYEAFEELLEEHGDDNVENHCKWKNLKEEEKAKIVNDFIPLVFNTLTKHDWELLDAYLDKDLKEICKKTKNERLKEVINEVITVYDL